jgi:hypothetical protein
MGIKIKDTEHVKEIKYEQMIPIGNVDTNDARHVEIGNLSDFVENNIKQKGTFATNEQLSGLSDAVVAEGENITFIDNKFTAQLETVGQQIATLQTQSNTYETWVFELEDGSTINKKVLINK